MAEYALTRIKQGERVFADETTLPTLAPGSGKAKTAYSWADLRDYAHPLIMRSSPGQDPLTIGFPDYFEEANCA
ncbi:Transposase IS66 family protein [Mesorhizobium loti]|nr:Transposase IS66 family protein [Mesorhizobium loti]